MTVRTRTLITIGATLLALIAIVYLGANLFLRTNFARFEAQRTRFELMRVEEALRKELETLSGTAGAWATRDESCRFVAKPTPDGFPGITDASLTDNGLDLVACFTDKRTLVYARGTQPESRAVTPLSHAMRTALSSRAKQVCTVSPRMGILLLPTGAFLVAACPIRQSNLQGNSRGTLVVGRSLDGREVNELSRTTHLQINAYLLDRGTLPRDVRTAAARLRGAESYRVTPVSDDNIAGYQLINDLATEPALVLRVLLSRGWYARGVDSLWYFLAALIAVGLAFSLLVMIVLEKQLLSPLARLSQHVMRIGHGGELSARLPVRGQDELAQVAGAVNGMLTALEASQEELRKKEVLIESEERYRTLVELSPDAVYILRQGQFVFANAAGVDLLGAAAPEDLCGQPLLGAIHPDHRPVIERRLRHLVDAQDWQPTEERFVRLDGTVVDVELTIIPFTYQNEAAVQVVARDITDRKRERERMNYLAYYDSLTGLPNRQLFNDRLTQALATAHRRKEQLTVIVLDLDRFKEINDSLGHQLGDSLLQAVATRLKTTLRESDTIARIGGDDFFLLLPNTIDQQGAEASARRLLDIFTDPFDVDGHELYMSASLGLSIYPEDGTSAETLVKYADTAMYRAKSTGRNNFRLYSHEMGALVSERRSLEAKLRKALERDELQVYFQPQIDLRTGTVVGMEALARWPHPELGMVPPMLFIPLAEETGLIEPLGEWVLRESCARTREFQQQGFPGLRVAVNVSAVQFQSEEVVDTITRVLRETGLSPESLEVEITESAAMQNIDHTLSVLRALDDLGVRIAIDDFGTGYSSFSYLTKFPIHTLKIDRSFIQDILHDADAASIVSAIIAMTHSLRRQVIAEAVETEEQVAFLRRHDCDEAQGYLYGKPVPPEEFVALCRTIDAREAVLV